MYAGGSDSGTSSSEEDSYAAAMDRDVAGLYVWDEDAPGDEDYNGDDSRNRRNGGTRGSGASAPAAAGGTGGSRLRRAVDLDERDAFAEYPPADGPSSAATDATPPTTIDGIRIPDKECALCHRGVEEPPAAATAAAASVALPTRRAAAPTSASAIPASMQGVEGAFLPRPVRLTNQVNIAHDN